MSALMASLAEHRRDIGVPAQQVADRLGVEKSTVSHWERGRRRPHWRYALAYAAAVRRRIVVWRGGVLAAGEDLPGALRTLREADGLTQRQLAARMHVRSSAVCMIESRATHTLPVIEAYLTALGAELRHLPLEAP